MADDLYYALREAVSGFILRSPQKSQNQSHPGLWVFLVFFLM